MQKNSPLKKYKRASKIYNQIWLILIVVCIGVLIMQLISGNLKGNQLQIQQDYTDFNCKQTAEEDLEQLPNEPLETNLNLSLIDTKTELVQTAQLKNTIPQITKPKFSKAEELEDCITDKEEVVVVTLESETKVYPKSILAQHLLINDKLGEEPILVSYCVLCDSVKVYSRISEQETLVFGTTGLLYKNSDMFYDAKTESLWSQFTGQALVGEDIGSQLTSLPLKIMSFAKAKEEFADAEILNFDTGFKKNYKDESLQDFLNNDKIIAPVANNNPSISSKAHVLGFEINSQKYAIEIGKIQNSANFIIDSKLLEVKINQGEITLTYDENPINFTRSLWYVWFDFYPETRIVTI